MKPVQRVKIEDLHKVAPKLSEVAPDFKIPEFKSDEEEIAWLNQNHERLAELTQKHGVKVNLAFKEQTQLVAIRLPVHDIDRAKRIAARNKQKYQAVLKLAVRYGLSIIKPQ